MSSNGVNHVKEKLEEKTESDASGGHTDNDSCGTDGSFSGSDYTESEGEPYDPQRTYTADESCDEESYRTESCGYSTDSLSEEKIRMYAYANYVADSVQATVNTARVMNVMSDSKIAELEDGVIDAYLAAEDDWSRLQDIVLASQSNNPHKMQKASGLNSAKLADKETTEREADSVSTNRKKIYELKLHMGQIAAAGKVKKNDLVKS